MCGCDVELFVGFGEGVCVCECDECLYVLN